MATAFELAVAKTLNIEGGYSNHPSDRGGATNWGITEAVARQFGYTGPMKLLPKATALDIYKKLYWDKIGLDWVASVSVALALELFDTGVNMGVSLPVRWLQRTLNALNRRGKDYPDLVVDGSAGGKVKGALEAYFRVRGRKDGELTLIRMMDALQGNRYLEITEARPANEDFMFGWARTRLGNELIATVESHNV